MVKVEYDYSIRMDVFKKIKLPEPMAPKASIKNTYGTDYINIHDIAYEKMMNLLERTSLRNYHRAKETQLYNSEISDPDTNPEEIPKTILSFMKH